MEGSASPVALALDLARKDLLAYAQLVQRDYAPARVHESIAAHLEAVERGEILRLWIRCHPRIGKSTLAARLFPAWYLGRHPERDVIVTTHDATFAADHGRAVRDLLLSRESRVLFPRARVQGRGQRGDDPMAGAAARFELTEGGAFRGAGVRGGIMGRGAHILAIDDPVRDAEDAHSPTFRRRNLEWYASVARLRLAPGAAIVGIDTSWGDGVLGSVLCAQPGWHVLSLPAICEGDAPCCPLGDWRKRGEACWPERWPEHALRALAAELAQIPGVGAHVWETHFQQRTTSAEGEVLKRAWMGQEYIEPPSRFTRTVIYWDPKLSGRARGHGASYAVGLVWGQDGARFYLLDRARLQADFPVVLDAMRDLCARYPDAACYVEPTATGPAAVEVLRKELPGVLLDEAVRGDKVERLGATAPTWEAGCVWLPNRRRAPWIDEYREELLAFPRGRADDYVDATSGALRLLLRAARLVHAAPGDMGPGRDFTDLGLGAGSRWP